jgi:hypothetical protein
MSLKHIQQTRQNITFGSDLNVPIADTYINGDLEVLGDINGVSSQGQDSNNIWTGTNTYSVYRPVSALSSVGLQDGVNKTFLDTTITNEGIVNAGATWTGTNNFTLGIPITTSTGSGIYIPPVNATDAVCGEYIGDSWTAKKQSYLTVNNTWTGTNNTFSVLPLVILPVSNTDIASKQYTDTTISSITQGLATSVVSQVSITSADWGATKLAVQLQIIGGGGGSTSATGSCVSSSAGVSGGSGSQASLIILTDTIVGGFGGAGLFDVSVGVGGSAGSGCGTEAGSGSGGSTNLYVTPKVGLGYNPTKVNILRANGGGGFSGSCGEAGNSAGGIYSAINSRVTYPFCFSYGAGGSQNAGKIPQYYGINLIGWGASGAACTNGSAGSAGGYGLTFFAG